MMGAATPSGAKRTQASACCEASPGLIATSSILGTSPDHPSSLTAVAIGSDNVSANDCGPQQTTKTQVNPTSRIRAMASLPSGRAGCGASGGNAEGGHQMPHVRGVRFGSPGPD